MTETFGLEPPWDLSPEALNAAELVHELKAGSGKVRELEGRRLLCDCDGRAILIARQFVAAESDTGEVCVWLWVAGGRSHGKRNPPTAVVLPTKPHHPGLPQVAQCRRCRATWLLFPGYRPGPPLSDGPTFTPGRVWSVKLPAPTHAVLTE